MLESQSQFQRVAHARPTFGRAGIKVPGTTRKPSQSAAQPTAQGQTRPDFIVEESGDFQMGRVISRTFVALGRNAVTFIALTALAAAPERIAVHLIGMDSKLAEPVSKLLIAFCGLALQAAVMKGVFRSFQGEKAQFGDCASAAMRNFFPVLAITILASLGVAAASLLLLVPGILLALSWSVAVPVRVAEGLSITACLGRSKALASGHRWKILLLGLLILLAAIPTGLVLQPLWGFSLPELPIFLSTNWLVRLVLGVVGGAGMASLYYELCLVKEGGAAQQVADAFD